MGRKPHAEAVGLASVLSDLAQRAHQLTEATLRHEFLQAVADFVRQATGHDPVATLEEPVLHGRTDARLGALVFEFKTPYYSLDEAIAPCLRYLDAYHQQGVIARGVAYNGTEMALLSETGAIVWQGRAEDGATLLEAWALRCAK